MICVGWLLAIMALGVWALGACPSSRKWGSFCGADSASGVPPGGDGLPMTTRRTSSCAKKNPAPILRNETGVDPGSQHFAPNTASRAIEEGETGLSVRWADARHFAPICYLRVSQTWGCYPFKGGTSLSKVCGAPPTEGSPTVRRSVITGSVALSLINNGTIVTHQVDPPDRVDQSNVRNWSRSITPVSRRPDTGVIGCG